MIAWPHALETVVGTMTWMWNANKLENDFIISIRCLHIAEWMCIAGSIKGNKPFRRYAKTLSLQTFEL